MAGDDVDASSSGADKLWEQASPLMLEALEQAAEGRTAYLRTACSGDKVLYDEVQRMLAEYAAVEEAGFLSSAPVFARSVNLSGILEDAHRDSIDLPDFEDYEVIQEIGRGGMGVVFKARQRSLNRLVALKVISTGSVLSSAAIDRFQLEAEAAAQLNHSGIVSVFEVGQQGTCLFYSMSLVDGMSLADRMRGSERPMPAREAADLIMQVADAVEHAHRNGVIHRDLKPANVLIGENNRPLVADFGLARHVASDSEMTVSGQIMGTPSYMPPEQARGKANLAGPSADIYSLGAMLYALVTGRPPFQGELSDILWQVVHEPPIAPRLLNSSVPRDVETICLKCLEKEPTRRYASAVDLNSDLRALLNGHAIQARPVSRCERLWRWCRRNPVVATMAAVSLGSMFALFIGLAASNHRLREAREIDKESLRQSLRAVNELYTRVSEERLLNEPGMQPLRRDLLKRAQDFYRELISRRGSTPLLQDELALARFRVGYITRMLESPAAAIGDLEAAESLQQRLVAEDPENLTRQAAWGTTWNELGIARARMQEDAKAKDAFEKAASIRAAAVKLAESIVSDEILEHKRRWANSHMNLGQIMAAAGDNQTAALHLEKAQKIRTELLSDTDQHAILLADLGKGEFALAKLGGDVNSRLSSAIDWMEQAVALAPDSLDHQATLETLYTVHAGWFANSGDVKSARAMYQQAAAIAETLSRRNPHVHSYVYRHATILAESGFLETEVGSLEKAIENLARSVKVLTPIAQWDSPPVYRRDLAAILRELASTRVQHSPTATDQAVMELEKALELLGSISDSESELQETRKILEDLRKQPENERSI